MVWGPEEPGVCCHETFVGGMEWPLQVGAPWEGFAAQGLEGSEHILEVDHLLPSAPLPGGLPWETHLTSSVTPLWTLQHPKLCLPHETKLPEGCAQ